MKRKSRGRRRLRDFRQISAGSLKNDAAGPATWTNKHRPINPIQISNAQDARLHGEPFCGPSDSQRPDRGVNAGKWPQGTIVGHSSAGTNPKPHQTSARTYRTVGTCQVTEPQTVNRDRVEPLGNRPGHSGVAFLIGLCTIPTITQQRPEPRPQAEGGPADRAGIILRPARNRRDGESTTIPVVVRISA